MKFAKKAFCLILALVMALSLSVTAFAMGEVTIDTSRTGSLNIYKYDITQAEAAGAWDGESYVSTGQYDESVNNTLGGAVNYAIKGVEFTYLQIADISTYAEYESNGNYKTITVYGMNANERTEKFLSILGLSYANAHHWEQLSDTSNMYYFVSDVLIDALANRLSANATSTKDALESYIASYGSATMPETDEYGHTSAPTLSLGLYLIVETSVPEDVVCTTNPFLVSIPMTTIDGQGWNYDITLYPKNNTGDPTLEKTLRESKNDTGKHNGTTNDITDGYAHTGTGSDGDVVDYQIVSTLPTITSGTSFLTTYTYVDTLSKGITYNKNDVVIEFFKDAGCTSLITTWTQTDQEQKFNVDYGTQEDGGSTMTISMTASGLAEINTAQTVHGTNGLQRGYSECTMRITYAATVNSDASVVYGDGGNPNSVTLTWKRTNTEYFDTLSDDCHVYTYGLDLLKQFSDGAGNFANVKMLVHNDTDNYYVKATLHDDGVYYVDGHAADEADATVFTPTEDGKIIVKGLEDDNYTITETATDAGYVLLKDSITVTITTAPGSMCDVCGKRLLTASASVNGAAVDMEADGESVNALVPLTVQNTKGFNLPQTGSNGTWIYTVVGILVMAGAAAVIYLLVRRKSARR